MYVNVASSQKKSTKHDEQIVDKNAEKKQQASKAKAKKDTPASKKGGGKQNSQKSAAKKAEVPSLRDKIKTKDIIVFPLPEAPTIAATAPSATSMLTSSKTVNASSPLW